MVEPVKIAYIIQCHKNAKQVNGLLLQLLNDNVDIYVHKKFATYIDGKGF